MRPTHNDIEDRYESEGKMRAAIEQLESLPVELDTIPEAFFRRAARHCFRFMSGYRQGLVGSLLDYTQRKYKGHRTIPAFVISDLEKEYEDNCKRKEKSRKFN